MIIGSKILFHKNLPSTNSFAASMIKAIEVTEGTIISTNHQASGRGQGKNKWESEDNKNLLISIVLYPTMVRPEDQFLLSMALSLGICDFIGHHTTGISIKWPNDIYVNNDKIAGILIENSVMGETIEHTIAGIGININQEIFLSAAPNPVSLSRLTGKQHDLPELLTLLAADLDRRYKLLISEDHEILKNDYHALLYRHNQWHEYRDREGCFTGLVLNVTESGRLRVKRESGSVSDYSFKEIDFIL